MGCHASKCISQGDRVRRNTIIVMPKASITVGSGIEHNLARDTRVVFIFGGPGCRKGNVVHNLITMFNFRFIGAEHIILKNVAEKLNISDAPIADLVREVKQNSNEVTLEWVLSMIQAEIEKSPTQPILVDVVPSMRFLSKSESFIKNCTSQMKVFESKFPISLAINLSVHKDKLITNTHRSHATTKPSQLDSKNKGGPSDEVDTSRTHKRFKRYEESVHDFIEYFKQSDRLLTVDTSCGRSDIVWESIQAYILNTEFAAWQKPLDLVILFCFDNEDMEKVDRERYPMKEITIADLVPNSQHVSLANVLTELGKHIDSQSTEDKHYIINVEDVADTETELLETKKKNLMFEEMEIGQLDYFIHKLRRRSNRKKSLTRKKQQLYKAICSTENEVLLFPQEVNSELCHRMAIFLAEIREDEANCVNGVCNT
eukprot:gene16986-18698_t